MTQDTSTGKQEIKLTDGCQMVRKICDACAGNGYRRIWKDQHEREKVTIQCSFCESSGEEEDEDFNYDYSRLDIDKLL